MGRKARVLAGGVCLLGCWHDLHVWFVCACDACCTTGVFINAAIGAA